MSFTLLFFLIRFWFGIWDLGEGEGGWLVVWGEGRRREEGEGLENGRE